MNLILSDEDWSSKTKEERRTSILALEEKCKSLKDYTVDLPVFHHHIEGVYGRELHIPKDTAAVGEIHKQECMNIILKGKLKIVNDEEIKIVEAPAFFISGIGTKRAAYTLEDTIWITFHKSNTDNVDELRKQIVAPSYDDVPKIEENK